MSHYFNRINLKNSTQKQELKADVQIIWFMFNEVVLCLCTQIVVCRRTGQRQQHLYEHYEHTQTKQTGVQMHATIKTNILTLIYGINEWTGSITQWIKKIWQTS